jgi:hypothetical protein
MASFILNGIITPDGQLHIKLPSDLTPGPVEVEIRQIDVRGISLGEILESDLVGMWADRTDIDDSVEYARELRRASRRNLE